MTLRTTSQGDHPTPSGKQKVMRVRDELVALRKGYLEQINSTCKTSVNRLSDVMRSSHYARVGAETAHNAWGTFGPNQGNIGEHIDALAGIVYGLETAISMLNEVLGEQQTERSKASEQDKGAQEEEPEGGTEEAADVTRGKPEARKRAGKRRDAGVEGRGAGAGRQRKPVPRSTA